VGGKLTTMRSLAEQGATDVLQHFGAKPAVNSRERPFPGAEDFPTSLASVDAAIGQIAARTDFSPASVRAGWILHGTRTEAVLSTSCDGELLPDTDLPVALARWSIAEEHVHSIADLVERRLMLLYHEHLSRACLRRLAELLVEQGRMPAREVESATDSEVARLSARFGKSVA
jgi:glycerol-3-phosphate dehydrogenase